MIITSSLVKIITNERTIIPNTSQTITFNALENDIRFFISNDSKLDSLQYQLIGYDAQAIATVYPEIRYTELEGGNYTLHVRKFYSGNVKENHSVKIEVERELTEEWWFWPSVAVYVMLLVGAGFYFFMINNFRQKMKVQSIRNRIASDLHDEVGATLSSIALSSNLVNRKLGTASPEIQSMLAQIKTDSEETIITIRDTVWTLNPDNDSFEKLIEKLRAFGYQIFGTKEIEFIYKNDLNGRQSPKLLMEQRRNAYLILREGLNNIAKHSDATEAELRIEKVTEGIKISLSDNGKGFVRDENEEGNGLKNFEKRAKEGFMDFDIITNLNKGTKMNLLIPEL